MYYIIYKITNTVNNKIYIGKHKTDNLYDNYFGSSLILKNSIKKYGKDKFKKEILYVFDNEDEMNKMEKNIVNEEFVSRSDTYNIKEGGEGGFGYIWKSKEQKEKRDNGFNKWYNANKHLIPELKKLSWLHFLSKNPDWVQTKNFSGHSHTDLSKSKISQSMKGKNKGQLNGNFNKVWITKDNITKSIAKENLDSYLREGWIKGRYLKPKIR